MRLTALLSLVFASVALAESPERSALVPGLNLPGLDHLFDSIFGKVIVKQSELQKTLTSLDEVAHKNGGNRAFGLPGYDASVDLILQKISEFDKQKAFKVWKQPFVGLWTQVTVHSFSVNGEDAITPATLTYSPSTPEGGIEAELVVVPGDAKPCNSEELLATGVDVVDKILLIERGKCPDGTTFAGKVKTAHGAGALAAIIYNSEDPPISGGTLTNPNPEYVPAGLLQRTQGLALRERILAGETLIAQYSQTQLVENRTTTNIFAETKSGDPSNVIMLGAHLDSVQAGPGINDDGSGTSLILELFRTLTPTARFVPNKVRFAWWGAEENGLLGSKHYVETLSQKDTDNLLVYLNFDMVSRGFYGVFDGDGSKYGLVGPPGSEVVEKLFHSHFKRKGLPVTEAAFSGGSDYAHFLDDLEKPIGGLFTGTGFDQDPCYHQACDTIDNPNFEQLYNNTLAAQEVLGILTIAGPHLIPKAQSSSKATVLATKKQAVKWTHLEDDAHSCRDEL
jgi:Zn-dependent M28 family amino/carboxypeptidase